MKFFAPIATALLATALTLVAPLSARAADATSTAKANAMAIANYRLTDSYLQHQQALALDLAHEPCGHGGAVSSIAMMRELFSGQTTIDQAVAQYAARPGMHALLAKHDLSARDAVVGGFAIMNAKMSGMAGRARASGAEVTTSGHETPVQRANIAFMQAHAPEVQAFQKKMGTIASDRVHQNGGHIPACEQNALKQLFGGMRGN